MSRQGPASLLQGSQLFHLETIEAVQTDFVKIDQRLFEPTSQQARPLPGLAFVEQSEKSCILIATALLTNFISRVTCAKACTDCLQSRLKSP